MKNFNFGSELTRLPRITIFEFFDRNAKFRRHFREIKKKLSERQKNPLRNEVLPVKF